MRDTILGSVPVLDVGLCVETVGVVEAMLLS